MLALRLRFHFIFWLAKVYFSVTRSITIVAAFTLLLGISGCGTSLFESKNEKTPSGPPELKKLDPDATHRPRRSKTGKAQAKLYKPATTVSLEIPPDLISATDETVLGNLEENKQNKTRVLPQIVGARIVKKEDIHGLEVDTSVESAWETVTQFWALSNVNLVEYNPEAGVMETEWIEQPQAEDPDASYIARISKDLFTSLTRSNTRLDKYRVRFERISANRSFLHVAHRSSARKQAEKTSRKRISEFEWVELSSDPNRVTDFLQHLILIFDDPQA